MTNKKIKLIGVLMFFGVLSCAGKIDPRHSQFDNIYSETLDQAQTQDLSLFVAQELQDLRFALQESTKEYDFKLNVLPTEVMIADGKQVGVLVMDVKVNETVVSRVSCFIFNRNKKWVTVKVIPQDMIPNLQEFFNTLPRKVKP